MIHPCTCKHEHQDRIHGKGNRVMNLTTKANVRCTVCKAERGVSRIPN